MLEERTPEREAFLIDQAARYIVDHDLEDFAEIALEGTRPLGELVGELGVMMAYPLAVTFFSRSGADFINMFGFDYRVNSEKLMKRIKELKELKEIHKQAQKKLEKKDKGEGRFSRLFKRIRS